MKMSSAFDDVFMRLIAILREKEKILNEEVICDFGYLRKKKLVVEK